MLNGISAATTGLLAEQRRMDALSHDVANADSTGFRAEDVVLEATGRAGGPAGVAARATGPSTAQGALAPTGRPLDLAIVGPGWFQVRGAGGQTALTRAGDLRTDASGAVVTSSGLPLVPPLGLPAGADPSALRIAPDGRATLNGAAVGKVQVVDVPAPSGLMALGGGLYAATVASGGPVPAAGAQIAQGALEGANTDLVDTSVGLLEARDGASFDTTVIRTQDEVLRDLLRIGDRSR